MPIPLDKLAEPFPLDQLKKRKGNFGQMVVYVDVATVIERLNQVLDSEWSFSVLDFRIESDEVIVCGQLEVKGVIRQQFGGSQITRKTDGGEVLSIADDLKAAAADCLKKCASSFGVGLYLYADSAGNRRNGNGNGRLTKEMIATLIAQAKEAGFTQADLIKSARQIFNSTLGQLTVAQAQDLVKQLNQSKEVVHAQT